MGEDLAKTSITWDEGAEDDDFEAIVPWGLETKFSCFGGQHTMGERTGSDGREAKKKG